MFKRILVPLDGSARAEYALALAALLARRCEADLLLVGITGRQWFPDLLTSIKERQAHPSEAYTIERYLKVVGTQLSVEGVRVETTVLPERPADGLVRQGAGWGVDLLVMAPAGQKGWAALLHPCVIWEVLARARVPVLACTPRTNEAPGLHQARLLHFLTNPAAPIIVPLDGSTRAEQALPLAQRLAWSYAHPLVLLRAAALPYYLAGGSVIGSSLAYATALPTLQEWALEETRSYLTRKQEELARTGLQVKTESLFGEVAACIEAGVRSHNAGLVVMAARGRGGLSRLLVGSVASRVLSCVEVPILLVPPPAHKHTSPAEAREQDGHAGAGCQMHPAS